MMADSDIGNISEWTDFMIKEKMILPPKNVSQGLMCIISFGGTNMTGIVRARYTLEFKQEAVRLVRGGQTLTSVSRGLGVSAQSIDNWVKADAVGGLKEAKGKSVHADQMEIARLKAELAKMRMERDILKKAAVYFARESR